MLWRRAPCYSYYLTWYLPYELCRAVSVLKPTWIIVFIPGGCLWTRDDCCCGDKKNCCGGFQECWWMRTIMKLALCHQVVHYQFIRNSRILIWHLIIRKLYQGGKIWNDQLVMYCYRPILCLCWMILCSYLLFMPFSSSLTNLLLRWEIVKDCSEVRLEMEIVKALPVAFV